QVDLVLLQERQLPGFGLRFLFRLYRNMKERDAVETGPALGIWMVADNERNVTDQLTALMPVEQIDQAVIVLRDEQSEAVRPVGALDAPAHLEALGDRGELGNTFLDAEIKAGQVPLDARQEQPALRVLMLVGVQDVGVVLVEKLRHRGGDPFPVGTV